MYREIARSKQLGEFVKNGVFPVQGQLDLNRNDWGVLYGDYYEIGKQLRQRTGLRGPLLTMGAENTSKTDEFLGLPTLQLYMNEVARGRKDGMTGISPQDKVARRLRTTWRDHWHGRQAGWRRRKRADTEKYDSEVKRQDCHHVTTVGKNVTTVACSLIAVRLWLNQVVKKGVEV